MEQNISLTSNSKSVAKVVHAVQGDSGRVLSISLDRTDLTASMTYNAIIEKPSGLTCYIPATFSATTNTISVALTNQALAEEGLARVQVEVTDTVGTVTTYSVYLSVEKCLRNDKTIKSTSQYTAIDEMARNTASVKAQFDSAVSAVTTDTELTDIRVKDDGKTSQTAGNAVREQIASLYNEIGNAINNIVGGTAYYRIPYTRGQYVDKTNGTSKIDASWEASDYVSIGNIIHHSSVAKKITTTTSMSNANYNTYNAFYDEDKNFISAFTLGGDVTVPTNAKYFRVSKEITAVISVLPYSSHMVDNTVYQMTHQRVLQLINAVDDIEDEIEWLNSELASLKARVKALENK